MPTLEEITAWSQEEIEAEIEKRLPEGWRLNPIWAEGEYWDYTLESPTSDGWSVEWLNQGFDRRLLALSAFGWLWLKDQPQHDRWNRRQELTREAVTQKVADTVPDPEDLDPDAIERLVHPTKK